MPLTDHAIISFDLFDTLLVRPFHTPAELFRHIEVEEQIPSFYKQRTRAQDQASDALPMGIEEVTLDDIYTRLPFPKEIELFWEEKLLRPRPEGIRLFQEAKRLKKRLILVSDTYLPQSFLEHILAQNGLVGFESLFISSEYKVTKRSGKLFDEVLKHYSAKNLLHIGDNQRSDIENAQKRGIATLFLKRTSFKENSFNVHQRAQTLFKNTTDPLLLRDLSLIAGLSALAYEETTPSFWEQIGTSFAGPVIASFLSWINRVALETYCEHLLFVARDGYWLHQLFPLFNPDLPTSYFYANRLTLKMLQENPDRLKEFRNILHKKEWAQKKLLIVDVNTRHYSAQSFLAGLGFNVLGAYWGTGRDNPSIQYCRYYTPKPSFHDRSFIRSAVIEFFMTAPEPPIKGIEFQKEIIVPEYVTPTEAEKNRMKIVQALGQGITAFVTQYQNFCREISFSPEAVILWNNLWLESPSQEELNHFTQVMGSGDDDHKTYHPQFQFSLKTKIKAFLASILNR